MLCRQLSSFRASAKEQLGFVGSIPHLVIVSKMIEDGKFYAGVVDRSAGLQQLLELPRRACSFSLLTWIRVCVRLCFGMAETVVCSAVIGALEILTCVRIICIMAPPMVGSVELYLSKK